MAFNYRLNLDNVEWKVGKEIPFVFESKEGIKLNANYIIGKDVAEFDVKMKTGSLIIEKYK